MVSRWDVLAIYRRATATNATHFLEALQARSPFPVKAVQMDGGSEFMAGFEDACRQQGIRLFVLPPRSPKLNGCVERANRTHTEEFYELYDGDLDLPNLNIALQHWEHIYNTVRPHQALGQPYASRVPSRLPLRAGFLDPAVSYVANEYITLTRRYPWSIFSPREGIATY